MTDTPETTPLWLVPISRDELRILLDLLLDDEPLRPLYKRLKAAYACIPARFAEGRRPSTR